ASTSPSGPSSGMSCDALDTAYAHADSRVESGSDSSKRRAGVMATRKSVTRARVGAPGSRAAIRDIAALAGVSVATVSRVLNGRPDVSPATRETVLRHIRDLGYVSNRNARALASGRTGLIGL